MVGLIGSNGVAALVGNIGVRSHAIPHLLKHGGTTHHLVIVVPCSDIYLGIS